MSGSSSDSSSEGDSAGDSSEGDDWAASVIDTVSAWFGGILEGLAVPFQDLASGIGNVWDEISDFRTSVNQALLDLPEKIFTPVRDFLTDFFVPDQELFDQRVQHLHDKISWVTEFTEFGSRITELLSEASGNKAPVIRIKLSRDDDSIWNANDIVIDFSWYEPYKPAVDAILGGMLWLSFLWNIFRRLPDIISGAGMVTVYSEKIDAARSESEDNNNAI